MRSPRVLYAAVLIALMLSSSSALSAHQLAFSKSMGVTVFAEGGTQWCNRQLQLTIDADDSDFFQSPDLAKLINVLGTKVLPSECELADAAKLSGRHQGATVWQGSTSKSDSWAVRALAVERPVTDLTAEQAPKQAVMDDAAAGVSADTMVPALQPAVAEPQAPATSQAVDGEVAAGEAAATVADFSIHGWTPKPVLRQEESKLNSVATKDQSCAVHYSVRPNDKGLVYVESELPCVDGWIHGNGKAVIKRLDGKQIAKLNGNFSRGFFMGKDQLDPDSVVGVNPDKPNNMLALLEADSDLKAYYLGNVAIVGANRWGFCHFAQVRLVTEDQDLFLNEQMIDLVVEKAAALVSQLCPSQRRFRFSAGSSPWDFDKQDHNVNYYVTQVHQDRRSKTWSFNKTRAWNGVIAARIAKAEQERLETQRKEREAQLAQQRAEREEQIARQAAERKAKQEAYQAQLQQQRAERAARAKAYQEQQALLNRWRQAKSDYERLANLGGVGRLAYLANVSGPEFPLDLYAEHVIRGEPASGAVLVRVSDDESDYSEVDWPVLMRLEDKNNAIDDEGVYFVIGKVTGGERQDDSLPKVTMEVERAWLCKERLCNDHGDVLSMVKTRHDYPDFDPNQQPEQPKWQ